MVVMNKIAKTTTIKKTLKIFSSILITIKIKYSSKIDACFPIHDEKVDVNSDNRKNEIKKKNENWSERSIYYGRVKRTSN